MEFRVLGNLEVVGGGGPRPLGSFRQRSVLALLVIHANSVVSTDRILDELWGDESTLDRQNTLWVHMSNLRSALEPDRPRRTEGSVVQTRAPGYLAHIGPDDLDAWQFERLLQEARGLLDSDPAAASMVVGEALALWRGRAYEDFLYESFAQAEIVRLEELRLEAVELRLDADLSRGLASELVGELEGLVRLHPMRERLTAQLMVALYRSSRTSEALRAYQRLRARLADELGIDPSRDLQRLESQILAADPALEGGAGTQPGARLAVRGYELREQVGDGLLGPEFRAYQPLVGREVKISVVNSELADDPDFIRRFEAVAELVARLEHPHIVPVYDYWREPGVAYLVTRWFRGGSLADALHASPLELARAKDVVREVASALTLAHSCGVVHGAVTPSSILMDEQGRAYLGGFAIVGDGRPLSAGFTTAYSSPEQLEGGPVTPRSDIYSFGALLNRTLGARPPAVTEVLERATARDPERRYRSAGEFAAAFSDAVGGGSHPGAPTASTNPYKGLFAFDEADAPDFFGRERIVERLLARIGEGGTRGRFVVLVGPSGSGKSSAVRAGLIPAIRRGALPGSEDWFITDMTPGGNPVEALGRALLRVAVDPPTDLVDRLLEGESGLRRAVELVLPHDRTQLLLIVDQFEEVFTQPTEATAHAFLDALVDAVTRPSSRLRVVLTLRADFYDRPLGHRAFGELVRRSTEVITPLAADELERAIDGPAERVGVRFEPGLMAEIVVDVAERPGALPLVQFALTELFERRRGSEIELAAYREMGGVSGALARQAEELYGELDDAGRETARQVLLRLVAVGHGDNSPEQIARRSVLQPELTALGPGVDAVLERFGRHRLLSFDRDPGTRAPTVEVAHEALLSEWDRLRTWINDARDDLRERRDLAQRTEEWVGADRDDDYLLRGPQLERLAEWASTTGLALSVIEREFLTASEAQRDDEGIVENARRVEERRLRRTARQRTRLLAGAGAVLAVVVALASFGVVQRRHAEHLASDLAAVAEARRLAAASAVTARDDPQLAMLLALQSLETSAEAGLPAMVEAEEALHWGLQAAHVAYPVVDAPVETRVGPHGLTGIYRLPLPELVSLARDNVARGFSAAECKRFEIEPCSSGGGLASPSSTGPREVPAAGIQTSAVAARQGAPLAGTTITVADFGERDAATTAIHERFEEETGIHVIYRNRFNGDLDRDPPDIIAISPMALRDEPPGDALIDLGTYVDADRVRQIWGDFLVDAASRGDGLYGLPTDVGLKGLVWYPKVAFENAGYTVPTSWDELIALSKQMVADGRTPWCMGLDSGGDGAWPATDWVEALVLRIGGTALYDRWVAHDIPFDDPAIAEAVSMFGQVVFGDGFVRGGPETVVRQNIFEAFDPMLDQPPGCWFSYSATYFPSLAAREGAVPGEDFDFFVLPPIQAGGPAPVFGEVSMVAAVTDRPEVREFMRRVMDPEAIPAWAASANEIFIPAHPDLDPAKCSSAEAEPPTNELRIHLCDAARSAVASREFRIDASDYMPPEIGLTAAPGERGQFLQGMSDYVTRGPDSLDAVLHAIEAAWPA